MFTMASVARFGQFLVGREGRFQVFGVGGFIEIFGRGEERRGKGRP
jgi:hypothetical protein